MKSFTKAFILAYDNSIAAFIPELWANEALAILEENMVITSLIHRDYSPAFANYGQVMNVTKVGTFKAKRKVDTEDVTVQDATATEMQVKLDQHWHTSFLIKDGQETLAFKSLVETYLVPAVKSIAQAIDRCAISQGVQFLPNASGSIGAGTKDTLFTDILDMREKMNVNLAPAQGRNIILTPRTETLILSDKTFLEAHTVGDEGSALREASLGRKLGFNFFMGQNTPAPSEATTTAGALDAAEAAGQTVISVAAGADETIGHWVTFAGETIPHRVIAASAGNTITVYPALKKALIDATVVTHYTQGAVVQASATVAAGGDGTNAGYRLGWHKDIICTGVTLSVGQMITFGVAADDAAKAAAQPVYVIVETDGSTYFVLDRPLEAAVANSAKINPGPKGQYNFAFCREALTMVNRPLALPRPGTGALAGLAAMNGLSIRVVITYDGYKQGHLVTVDMLGGFKVMHPELGGILLA